MAPRPQLIAIIGPTASGKTALALDIAERYNGEIICADSRTVYKGMDIGTAKPTKAEQARIKHWCLDLVEPGQGFTAADFKREALNALGDIHVRGKFALLVGGTGLYVDSVLYDYSFAEINNSKREEFEKMTLEQLWQYCEENNVTLPKNSRNKRHVVNAVLRTSISGIRKSSLSEEYKVVGIATHMNDLRTRIVHRSEHLFSNGVEEEATMLGKKYGWNSEAMTGNIYPLIKRHLEGELTQSEIADKFATADYRLAKRQMTWFRRNPDIEWCTLTGARDYIHSVLATE